MPLISSGIFSFVVCVAHPLALGIDGISTRLSLATSHLIGISVPHYLFFGFDWVDWHFRFFFGKFAFGPVHFISLHFSSLLSLFSILFLTFLASVLSSISLQNFSPLCVVLVSLRCPFWIPSCVISFTYPWHCFMPFRVGICVRTCISCFVFFFGGADNSAD